MQQQLFQFIREEKEPDFRFIKEIKEVKTKLYPGVIRIKESTFKCDVDRGNKKAKEGDTFISVGFEGHLEGSGCPCFDSEEARQEIKFLMNKHKLNYKIEIIDERPY